MIVATKMHCKTVKDNYFHLTYILNSLGEATIRHMCDHCLPFSLADTILDALCY